MYALRLRDQVVLIEDDVAEIIHSAIAAEQQFVAKVPLDLSGTGEEHEVTLNLGEVRSMTRIRDTAQPSNVVPLRR